MDLAGHAVLDKGLRRRLSVSACLRTYETHAVKEAVGHLDELIQALFAADY